MAFEFKFPDIGEGITKGKIVSWAVKEGDKVKEDQTIAKVETDKALADIPSPKTGTIQKIMVQAGNDVSVGQTLVTIAVEGEEAGPSSKPQPELVPTKVKTKPEEGSTPADGGTGAVGELESAKGKTNLFDFSKIPIQGSPAEFVKAVTSAPTGLAMPRVKQLAKQQGIDISQVQGTGPQGSVKEIDLQKAPSQTLRTSGAPGTSVFRIKSPSGDVIEIIGNIQSVNVTQAEGGANHKQPPIEEEVNSESKDSETGDSKPKAAVTRKYDQYGYVDRKPYEGVRKLIGENMRKSIDTAAHVTAMDEIDVTDLWQIREKEEKNAKKKGVTLTFLPYITRACIKAIREVPSMNATLDEDTQQMIYKKYFNAGYAVATDAGLMVVVVKRAENKTLWKIGKELHELAQQARDRKIGILDLKGSSFTISNWGSIHGSYGTPIINPGESAILGIGRIRQVPAYIGKKVELRYLLPISLTFDHRITDGAEAAKFLKILSGELENPKNLEDKPFLKGLKKEEIFDI